MQQWQNAPSRALSHSNHGYVSNLSGLKLRRFPQITVTRNFMLRGWNGSMRISEVGGNELDEFAAFDLSSMLLSWSIVEVAQLSSLEGSTTCAYDCDASADADDVLRADSESSAKQNSKHHAMDYGAKTQDSYAGTSKTGPGRIMTAKLLIWFVPRSLTVAQSFMLITTTY